MKPSAYFYVWYGSFHIFYLRLGIFPFVPVFNYNIYSWLATEEKNLIQGFSPGIPLTLSMEWRKWTCLRIWEMLFQNTPCVFVNVNQITKINKGKVKEKNKNLLYKHAIYEEKKRRGKKMLAYIQEGTAYNFML